MKLSRKYKETVKTKVLLIFACIALVTLTLAVVKLAGISMPEKINNAISYVKLNLDETNDENSETENTVEINQKTGKIARINSANVE